MSFPPPVLRRLLPLSKTLSSVLRLFSRGMYPTSEPARPVVGLWRPYIDELAPSMVAAQKVFVAAQRRMPAPYRGAAGAD